jgi:hypothetical protein
MANATSVSSLHSKDRQREAGNRLNMQDTGPPPPRMGTPLIAVPVDGLDVGQVQERIDGGLLGALAAEEVGGRLC